MDGWLEFDKVLVLVEGRYLHSSPGGPTDKKLREKEKKKELCY